MKERKASSGNLKTILTAGYFYLPKPVKQNLFDSVLNEGNTKDSVDFSDKGRAHFLQQLEEAMTSFSNPYVYVPDREEMEEAEQVTSEKPLTATQQILNFEEYDEEKAVEEKQKQEQIRRMEEVEAVMNKGLDFLSGLFKMSTGKELNSQGNRIEMDKETGEVVMRFKVDF